MSAPSRDDLKKKSEQRVNQIDAWIEKNPNCLIEGRKHNAFYQGKDEQHQSFRDEQEN